MRNAISPCIIILRSIIILLVCIKSQAAIAQNLIPNGDFESYDACPRGLAIITPGNPPYPFPNVRSWTRPTAGSSDYFNSCASLSSTVSVPVNYFGYQPAHSGNAYAGIGAYVNQGTNDYREYLSARLVEPLKKDSFYCVRFFVSPALNSDRSKTWIGISELGSNFSDTLLTLPGSSVGPLLIPFHIRNDTSRFLTDTALWYEITGFYKAHGGESWMTIGCFAATPNYVAIDGSVNTPYERAAYYFIDDVSVELISGPVQTDSMHDTLVICSPENRPVELSAVAPTGPYYWNTGDTTRKLLVNQPGMYICTTVISCKRYTHSFIVVPDSAAAPIVRDTMICQSVTAPVLLDNAPGLIWYTDPSNDPGSPQQPVINTSKGSTTTIYVARQERSCTSKKMPLTVTIKELPQSHPTETGFRCADGTRSYLTLGSGAVADEIYSWNSGESSCCIQPQNDGRYIREATNVCGTAIDTFYLLSRECDSCLIFPNAFSPNNDGRNDGFRAMEYCPIKDYRLRVYNRWGEQVFVADQLSGYWNGQHKGKPAPAGTYMYFASFRTVLSDKEYIVKGSVILFR